MKWKYFALLAVPLFLMSANYTWSAHKAAYNHFETKISTAGNSQICHWFYAGDVRMYARRSQMENACEGDVRVFLNEIPVIDDIDGNTSWSIYELYNSNFTIAHPASIVSVLRSNRKTCAPTISESSREVLNMQAMLTLWQ